MRVSIDAGLLQMIINGLLRDATEGRFIRQEWVDEINKDVKPILEKEENYKTKES